MEKYFVGFTLRHIPRAENTEADELAKAAAQSLPLPPDVFYQVLSAKAIQQEEQEPKLIHSIISQDWRSAMFAYLSGSYEPSSKKDEQRMRSRAKQYSIIGDNLYKKGIVAPWLKCISKHEGIQLLKEMHAGMCGAHRGPHEIAHRAMRQGFYWPSAAKDACELVKHCPGCQMFAKNQLTPANPTSPIIPTWPFQRWGIDIVGPLPAAPGNLRFAVVALEYFSKWIEAKALANITSTTIMTFVWQRIICRFGVPAFVTCDNGKQFDSTEFRNFCDELKIKLNFASVNYPKANGAVERANGLIFVAISKSLFDAAKGKWPKELITAVWGHNISKSRATGFTPFRLLYGDEAITPEEINFGSFRTEVSHTTEVQRQVQLETVEGDRALAANNLDKYHAETKSLRDRKILRKNISPGDFVLVRHPDKQGKLQSQWYGPFVVSSEVKPGVFRLKDGEGSESIHTWNAETLRRFYP